MEQYPIFKSGLTTHPGAASRADAERAHARLMAVRHERIEQLLRFVSSDGAEVAFDPSSLQPLNDWFLEHIEVRKVTGKENAEELVKLDGREHLVTNFRLTARTESLIVDVALFIGELLIRKAPHLTWRFVERPKNEVSFQRTVLSGFRSVKNKKYYVDLELIISTYAYKFTRDGDANINEFVILFETGLRRA